jgi:hypothetical protein
MAFIFLFSLMLAACSSTPTTISMDTETPDLPDPPMTKPSLPPPSPVILNKTDIPVSVSNSIYLSAELPDGFVEKLHLPADWKLADNVTSADYSILINHKDSRITNNQSISTWVYVLVAPFPTIADSVLLDDFYTAWSEGNTQHLGFSNLFVSTNTFDVFQTLWGEPDPTFVNIISTEDIQSYAWESRDVLALIPFEILNPQWKVLEINNQNPLHKSFNPELYPLSVQIEIRDNGTGSDQNILSIPTINRDPDQLTTVILTGVTALVRATGIMMEREGLKYPGLDIRDWLREADFTHINNEVPFAERCPSAFLQTNELKFCSKPEFIELLEDIGTDIVELSGDHFEDWGPEATLYSLKLYEERGWKTYGGGESLADARQPVLIEHNGNKLAFLGCNAKLPGYARASDTHPGAAHCDWDWMEDEILRLRNEGYLPIITFQHEEYYDYFAHPKLQIDFHQMAESGAVIISGSQAHQPHAMEFYDGAFLHYGLGNLFFDQYLEGIPMRQAFIDRHVFYNGRHVNTELLTIMFIDFARPRPMTESERIDLLDTIFTASSW